MTTEETKITVQFKVGDHQTIKQEPYEGCYNCPQLPQGFDKVWVPSTNKGRDMFREIPKDTFVDKEHCDSYSYGTGCKYKATCPAYDKPGTGIKDENKM